MAAAVNQQLTAALNAAERPVKTRSSRPNNFSHKAGIYQIFLKDFQHLLRCLRNVNFAVCSPKKNFKKKKKKKKKDAQLLKLFLLLALAVSIQPGYLFIISFSKLVTSYRF